MVSIADIIREVTKIKFMKNVGANNSEKSINRDPKTGSLTSIFGGSQDTFPASRVLCRNAWKKISSYERLDEMDSLIDGLLPPDALNVLGIAI